MKFTGEAYYEAALEHVDTSRELLNLQRYALANYTAGVAVECIFRAYSYRYDKIFDCRHDLRAWYDAARFDNIVPELKRSEISAALSVVTTHWANSQRYCSVRSLRAYFKLAQLDRGLRGDLVKELCRRTVDASFEIVTLGDRQWDKSFKK